MRTIYKYQLPRDGCVIEINEYVEEFLHVGTQNGVPMLWAVVDPDRVGKCEVVAWGTGWDLPNEVWLDCEYIGTCGDAYGYIWHYFARFAPRAEEAMSSAAVCGLAADSAISSVDFTVSLDEDALSQILGLSKEYTNNSTGDYTITYLSNCADAVSATGVSFARA